ncbi:MAG: putative TYPE II DNA MODIFICATION ENZYME (METHYLTRANSFERASE) [Candidatus Jettenia ecosi]|uniref:Methyltransferase n=1 Tax=Candidatus Jettenia ecosi TaxID=2494326 RepID=A0A533Q8V6_9BACT|nr:MAG: putative TYPE II DNA MODIFICATION ENZYME (METHYLTRANSFERASE) [Candidatus Jettenia ecosi]
MISKEYIRELKHKGNGAIIRFVNGTKENNTILYFLENLGYLPKDFDGSWLLNFLNNKNNQIRFWAVKNLGKLSDESYLSTLSEIAKKDSDTSVRREAVSSLGRMRNPKSKEYLFDLLNDEDPKVVCQAIRGLLVFRDDKNVQNVLKPLINHPNEMVKSVIYKEYFSETKTENEQPHPDSYDYLKNIVVNGDVREILKNVPDESIHLTFTSPPYYNARDYSIYPSYKDYLLFLNEVFKEVHRITKEGRFFILNTSPIIIPRVSRAHSSKRYSIPFDIHPYLIDMGWEFIDDIIWLKPEASVKNRNAGFLQHRKPLGYKPNAVTEYLMVYRKKTEKLLDWNIRQYDWSTVKESKVEDGYETTNVWKIDPTFDKVHSAVFPVELCKRVIKYYSFKGDLIFDPFAGSGTVGETAKNLNRYFFLTEKDEKYFNYMEQKIHHKSLFKEKETSFLTLEQFIKTKNI